MECFFGAHETKQFGIRFPGASFRSEWLYIACRRQYCDRKPNVYRACLGSSWSRVKLTGSGHLLYYGFQHADIGPVLVRVAVWRELAPCYHSEVVIFST